MNQHQEDSKEYSKCVSCKKKRKLVACRSCYYDLIETLEIVSDTGLVHQLRNEVKRLVKRDDVTVTWFKPTLPKERLHKVERLRSFPQWMKKELGWK